ncbi:MAG: hypothetical protein EP346_00030 [Bacteroidetes bacterium]|nr:MAG: hypothetical protein EP346_00030 [Bacteroidota bacterium]
MGKVLFADKDKTQPIGTAQKLFRDIDANELKNSINSLYDVVDALTTTVTGIADSVSKAYHFELANQDTVQHPAFVGLTKADFLVILESVVISATDVWKDDPNAYNSVTGEFVLQEEVSGELVIIIIKKQN